MWLPCRWSRVFPYVLQPLFFQPQKGKSDVQTRSTNSGIVAWRKEREGNLKEQEGGCLIGEVPIDQGSAPLECGLLLL